TCRRRGSASSRRCRSPTVPACIRRSTPYPSFCLSFTGSRACLHRIGYEAKGAARFRRGTMKRWIAGLVVVAALAAAAVFGMRMMAQPPEELDLARDKPSATQLYRVSIQPELDPPAIGTLHNWIVTVLLSDGEPVVDAKMSVAGGMPQHGHGLTT